MILKDWSELEASWTSQALVKNSASADAGDGEDIQSLSQIDPLEDGMATHSTLTSR